MTPEQIKEAHALIQIARILDNSDLTNPHMFYSFAKSSNKLADALTQALNALEAAQQDQQAAQVREAALEGQLAGEKQAWKNGFTIGKHRAIRVLGGAEWGVGGECLGRVVVAVEKIIAEIREVKE